MIMKSRMKSAALLVALFGLSACDAASPSLAGNPPSEPLSGEHIASIAESIDERSVQASVEQLSGAQPAALSSGEVRISERGSDTGRANARQYIREKFASYGLKAEEHEFTSSSGRKGKNVEALIPGNPDGKHLYVTAHLDSVSNPGANDDASGVAVLLATAEALAPRKPRDTIHFVAFDLEEPGLIGAYYYVRDKVLPLGKDRVIGNLQVDMVGHDSGGARLVYADCGSAPELRSALEAANNDMKLGLALGSGCSSQSDHARFEDEGMPAAMIADDMWYGDYPWYHEETDTADRLNWDFLTKVAKAVTGATANLAFESK